MKRYPFLDWMRGLAVVLMILCHVFNSFTRIDLREGGPYLLSQFVGGMAAPLFLFMAGMTFAFQMDSLDRRVPDWRRRWLVSLRRGGYILGIAFLFRFTNFLAALPHAPLEEITKVDILNCMGVAMAAFSVAAAVAGKRRARFAAVLALAIAAAAPLISNLPWDGVPALLRDYLVPSPARGRFPFFPCASYVGFGLATGTVVKRTAAGPLDRLIQWSVLIAFPLVFAAQYFSNLPYSIYPKSDFWRNSPGLVLMRVGVMLLIMAASWLWTEFGAGSGWSWMQCLGKNSLMVYWVHVMLVYGDVMKPVKRALDIPGAALATLVVTALMVGLSAAWLAWKGRRRQPPAPPAGQSPELSHAEPYAEPVGVRER